MKTIEKILLLCCILLLGCNEQEAYAVRHIHGSYNLNKTKVVPKRMSNDKISRPAASSRVVESVFNRRMICDEQLDKPFVKDLAAGRYQKVI